MNEKKLSIIAAICLVIGGVLGIIGSFVSPSFRGIAWGVDGTSLVIASALLSVHYIKHRNQHLAAAFLIFLVGQTLVVSGSAMKLSESSPLFASGAGLWAASLALICTSSVIPIVIRVLAGISSVLFAITAIQIYGGAELNPLSKPLPFFAYPIFVFTLFGLAWLHLRLPAKSNLV
ncbi:hypothetical protein KDN34_08280 [Shewanella yunxiaonensis]|uniref:Uncharacterized protein n=1 Tax=Shewanella yunxiaonensis TaxID=2829809 RepID=A0ABX7YX60_9GAMM|nr:hypothetical protein [Shewanella yunxiaonensis]QUN07380.1 hypothetical protein KDN34_08280 [Shewanella yunxiaonensis]